MFFMVDFSCSFVSVCKLRKPLGGASSKLRSPHAPPKNPLRWARLAVACRTSVDEGRLTSCSPSAKARRKRLSATACPQQALLPATRATARSPWPEGRSARRGNGLRNSECLPSSQIHSYQLRQNYNKKEIRPTYNNTKPFSPISFFKKRRHPHGKSEIS